MEHRSFLILVTLAVAFILPCSAYRILGVFPLNGKSHNIMFEALVKGLAKRGHQVDVITHFPAKNPPNNLRTIVNLDGTLKSLINNVTIQYATRAEKDSVKFIAEKYGNELCDLMGLPVMQEFIKNPPRDTPYDLLITEVYYLLYFHNFIYLSTLISFSFIFRFFFPFFRTFFNLFHLLTTLFT